MTPLYLEGGIGPHSMLLSQIALALFLGGGVISRVRLWLLGGRARAWGRSNSFEFQIALALKSFTKGMLLPVRALVASGAAARARATADPPHRIHYPRITLGFITFVGSITLSPNRLPTWKQNSGMRNIRRRREGYGGGGFSFLSFPLDSPSDSFTISSICNGSVFLGAMGFSSSELLV